MLLVSKGRDNCRQKIVDIKGLRTGYPFKGIPNRQNI